MRVDKTRKGERIEEIKADGYDVITAVLADDLTEYQALKLEAELISAFGSELAGGVLTNSVIPEGVRKKVKDDLIIPSGVVERLKLVWNF